MKYFNFIDDQLSVEDLKISDIAKEVGTPFYCYSKKNIIENYQVFYNAFKDIDHKICYAIKANPNINIVKIFAAMGAGIDVVSKGEIYRAIKAGIEPKNIVFAGVGKKADEIEYALNEGVEEFSVESEPELYLLNEVAQKNNKIAKFSLRVNPDVDAKKLTIKFLRAERVISLVLIFIWLKIYTKKLANYLILKFMELQPILAHKLHL